MTDHLRELFSKHAHSILKKKKLTKGLESIIYI